MSKTSLDLFGQAMISSVRDSAYERYLSIKNGELQSIPAKKIEALINNINNINDLDEIVLDVIDSVIFRILRMLEENDATLIGEWGKFDAQTDSDGLCGEIFGKDGWIEKFSSYKPSK